MNGKSRVVFCLLLFALFFAAANAGQVSVSINPKNPAQEVLSLYPDEIGELELIVFNIGDAIVENLVLRVSVERTSIMIVDGENLKTATVQTVSGIEPGKTKSIFIKLKPKEFSKDPQPVTVSYGFDVFTHDVKTYVEVLESPLEVQARLGKSALDLGDKSKLVLNLKNRGQEPILNISAGLVLTQGINDRSSKLEISQLAPGEGVADREFPFDAEPSVVGERRIVLLVSFEDSRGRHILEGDYFIDVQNRKTVLYLIIIAVIALIVVALFLKRKPMKEKKSLEQPVMKELDGEKLKTVPTEGKEIRK